MKKGIFVMAAVMIGSRLLAQDTTEVSPFTSRSLENVVLTTNKYPKKQGESGKVLNVIDRQQIERSGGKTLTELLNTVAGINMIGTNNSLGNNISPSIRGAAVGNVLVLIDGIPVNDPSVISGIFDLNFINLDQVERIEILKGGQSTLYGSDAVAGVINIITKRPAGNKLSGSGAFTVGSYNTLKQSVGIAAQGKKAGFSVDYTHLESDGLSAAYDSTGKMDFDDDGYDQHIVNARFNNSIGKNFRTQVFGLYSNYKTELDGAAFQDDRDFFGSNINKQVGAAVTYTYGKGLVRGTYSFNHAERKYRNEALHVPDPSLAELNSRYIGRTHFAELYGNLKMDRWELLLGADYRAHSTDQDYASDGMWGPYSFSLTGNMNQYSGYGSFVYKQDKGFNAELGGRLNVHSAYGTNFTFTFNPFFQAENRNKFFANVYSSFKAPTLYQLFDAFAGNPDLEAEKGITLEAGAELKSVPALKTRIVGFYRDGKDAILYTFDPNTFMSRYVNAAKQTSYGLEIEAGYRKEKKDFSINYTYTDGRTTAAFDGTGTPLGKDTTYYNLYRIPKHTVNLVLGYHAAKNIYTSLLVHAVTDRDEYVYAGAPEILKGYATLDVYGEYRFSNSARFFLDLKNITNNKYFDFLGYNARRFNFTTGISFQL